MPFSVGVRESLMIAHSFKGEEFGPAQRVRFFGHALDGRDTQQHMLRLTEHMLHCRFSCSSTLPRMLSMVCQCSQLFS